MKKNEIKNTKAVKIKKIAPKKYNIKNNGKERVPIIGIFEKKEKIRRPRIILVEDAISPKVDATSCPSYGLPKLR